MPEEPEETLPHAGEGPDEPWMNEARRLVGEALSPYSIGTAGILATGFGIEVATNSPATLVFAIAGGVLWQRHGPALVGKIRSWINAEDHVEDETGEVKEAEEAPAAVTEQTTARQESAEPPSIESAGVDPARALPALPALIPRRLPMPAGPASAALEPADLLADLDRWEEEAAPDEDEEVFDERPETTRVEPLSVTRSPAAMGAPQGGLPHPSFASLASLPAEPEPSRSAGLPSLTRMGMADAPQETLLVTPPGRSEGDVSRRSVAPLPPPVLASLAPPPVFPVGPEQETLRLGQALDQKALRALCQAYESGRYQQTQVVGRRFDPHFNRWLGKGWVTAATQGGGKSVLNGVILEQAGKCGLPVFVLDHKGEYGTVKDLPFMQTWTVGAAGQPIPVDVVLTPEPKRADELVEHVFARRTQAIINLPTYGPDWVDRATIAAVIGQALMRYAERQSRQGKRVLPCLVMMDEAQLYLPQDQSLLPPQAQENKAVLSTLKNAYYALVSNGRSAGYTVGFATQSLTYLAKWAIKSTQVRILGRHAEKNDLDECERIIDPAVATRQHIESFPPGVGVVFGLTTQPMVVQFDRKQARDLSQTPRIEWLSNPSTASQPAKQQPTLPVQSQRPEIGTPAPLPKNVTVEGHARPGLGRRYHRHQDLDPATRARLREDRLRATPVASAALPASGNAETGQSDEPASSSVEQEVASPPVPPINLATYLKKPPPRLPSLMEVMAAFPDRMPPWRTIRDHYGLTDHQAQKLYNQLKVHLKALTEKQHESETGGWVDDERMAHP